MTTPIRVWVKKGLGIIQAAEGEQNHFGRFSDDGTVYDYKGNPFLLQALLELWAEKFVDRFETTREEISQSEWMQK